SGMTASIPSRDPSMSRPFQLGRRRPPVLCRWPVVSCPRRSKLYPGTGLQANICTRVSRDIPRGWRGGLERIFDRRYVRNTTSIRASARPPGPGSESRRKGAPSMTAIALGRPAPAPRLRLTRRGRAVISALVAAPLVVLALALGAPQATATLETPDQSFEWVSVDLGQSLWSIAQSVAPDEDPREVVADIMRLNGLGSADVQPGQRIAIPPEYTD